MLALPVHVLLHLFEGIVPLVLLNPSLLIKNDKSFAAYPIYISYCTTHLMLLCSESVHNLIGSID